MSGVLRRFAAVGALGVAVATGCGDATPRGVPWSADPAARRAALPNDRPRLGIGTPADPARIAAWDLDVDTLGHGLPPGRGTVAEGGAVYAAKCAACHGARGEGLPPAYPKLVGREPRNGFGFASDPGLARTVGNYWPYATTLYDYVRRAMPYNAPGTLTADETYALTAWLLAANEILPVDAALDSASLMRVRMPAAGRFVDDARGR